MSKKTIMYLLIALLMSAAAAPLMADSQVDIGVNVPVIIGVTIDGQNASQELPFTIPIPDLMYNYYFGPDFLKIGVGFRAWTIIFLSAGYPIISAEMDLGPLVLNANIGGGLFVYGVIGGGINADTGNIFLPEISAGFRLTDWFSLGVGVLGVYLPDVTNSGMGYAINVIGRFTVVK